MIDNCNNRTIKDIEVSFRLPPDLEIIFQSGEIYRLNSILSMKQNINNNFNFKNSYEFTTPFLSLDLLKLLEHSSHQIKEVKIIEELKTDKGENFIKTHSISLPVFSASRKVDISGTSRCWTIKISEKF